MQKTSQHIPGAAVVSLSDHVQKTRFALLPEVEAYWNALRGGDVAPARADVDPRGLEAALQNCFIIERIAPGLGRIRIAGSHLTELLGMEVRGMPISAFIAPGDRADFGKTLEAVFVGPAVGRLSLHSPAGFGKSALEAQMVLLPLRSDLGDINRALGCLVTRGRVGSNPRRFDIIGASAKPVSASPSPAPIEPKRRAPVKAEVQEARQPPIDGRSHLTLVHSEP